VLELVPPKEIVPDAAPAVCGVNVSVSDTVWPAAIVVGREIPLRPNSALVDVAEEMVTPDPVAVTVAGMLLLVPTGTPPKSKVLALEVNCPAETPAADKAIFRDRVPAFETTAIVPEMFPLAIGVHRTLNVTLCPLLRLAGRVKSLTPNPAPVTAACEMVTVELPVLVKVSNCVRLLPSGMLPKASFDELGASV
jgi:hypothetical protein